MIGKSGHILFEVLEPRILLSADSMLNSILLDRDQDTLPDGMQQVVQYTELLDESEQVEEQISQELAASDTSNTDDCKLVFTLFVDNDNTDDESIDADLSVDNVGAAQVNGEVAVLSSDFDEGVESRVSITEDENPQVYVNDAKINIEENTSIEIRGPPACQIINSEITSSSVNENMEVDLSIPDEYPTEVQLSATISLPGMYLVDQNADYFGDQIVYLNFDGGQDVAYYGPEGIVLEDINVPEYQVPGYLNANRESVIELTISCLRDYFFYNSGIIFTTSQPESGDYSTIYVGGDDSQFASLGEFYGIAENLDIANQNQKDNAFVFAEEIPEWATSTDEYSGGLAQLIAHEVGRLLGFAEKSEEVVPDQEITLNEVDLGKDHVKVDGVTSTSSSGTFYVDTNAYVWFEAQFTHWWAGDHGGINMSFPYFDGSYYSKSWTGDQGSKYYPRGYYPIYHKDGTPITCQDPMVEGYDSYWGNIVWYETLTLKVQLIMSSSNDYFKFRTRAWIGSTFVPLSGPNDQQGYDVYEYNIYAQTPPDLKVTDMDCEYEPWNWGDTVQADLEIYNEGGQDATNITIKLIASNDTTLFDTDDHVISTWTNQTISASSYWSRSNYSFTLPSTPWSYMPEDGTVYYFLHASTASGETDTADNYKYDSVNMDPKPQVTGLRWETSGGGLATTVEAGNTVYAEVTGNYLSGTIQLQVHEDDLGITFDTGKRIDVPVSSTGGRKAWAADWDLDWPAATSDPEYVLVYVPEGDKSGILTVTDNTAPNAPTNLQVTGSGGVNSSRTFSWTHPKTDVPNNTLGSGFKEFVLYVDNVEKYRGPNTIATIGSMTGGSHSWRVEVLDNENNMNYTNGPGFNVFDVTGLRWETSGGGLATTVEAGDTVYAEVTGNYFSGTIELQVHEDDWGILSDTGKRIYVPVSGTWGRKAWTADWDLDFLAATSDPEYVLFYAPEGDKSGILTVTDDTAPAAPTNLQVTGSGGVGSSRTFSWTHPKTDVPNNTLGSGFKEFVLKIDGQVKYSGPNTSATVSGMTGGSHSWLVEAWDNEGNKSQSGGPAFTVFEVTGLRWETSGGSAWLDNGLLEAGSTIYARVFGQYLSGTIQLQLWEDDWLAGRYDTGKRINVPVSSSGGTTSWTADWDNDSLYGLLNSDSDPEYVLVYTGETPNDVSLRLKVTDNTGPSEPSLITPASNITIEAGKVQFVWSQSSDSPYGSGMDKYALHIADNISFVNQIILETANTSEVRALSSDTYWWKVVAYDEVGNPTTSETMQFIVDQPTILEFAQNELQTGGLKPLLYLEGGFGLGLFGFNLAEIGMSATIDLADLVQIGGEYITLDGKDGYVTTWIHGDIKLLSASLNPINTALAAACNAFGCPLSPKINAGIRFVEVTDVNEDPELAGEVTWFNSHIVAVNMGISGGIEPRVTIDINIDILSATVFEWQFGLSKWEVRRDVIEGALNAGKMADPMNFASSLITFFIPDSSSLEGSIDTFESQNLILPFTTTGGAIPDNIPPIASLTSINAIVEDTPDVQFTVQYSDNGWINASGIDSNDILVTGPGGYNQVASLVSKTSTTDTSPISATYKVNAPSGTWDYNDNGNYAIYMQPNQVSDTASPPNYVAAGVLDQFQVTIAPTANNDAYTTDEDTILNVPAPGILANDTTVGGSTAILISGPSHGILTLNADGSFAYGPELNYNGPDSFTYKANDGSSDSNVATVSITINPVNDMPSFTKGSDIVVNEDSGPYTEPNWATNISAGPANESSQTVGLNVNNDNNSLFLVQPVIGNDGTLTFTPGPNAFGSAIVTVNAHDDGGTANGGQDTSAPQTFLITVNPVNDAPSFTKGSDVMMDEDSGHYAEPNWATNISAGPANESSQTVSFNVSNDNNDLFLPTEQPEISPDGTLTFTPAPDAFGSAMVTVIAQDDGGTANGGHDTSPPQTFVITVNPVNDDPEAVDDYYDIDQDSAANVLNVLDNDTYLPDALETLTINDKTNGGYGNVVIINGGAQVTYTPNPGYTGPDSFTYKIEDGNGGSNWATVDISIRDTIAPVVQAWSLSEDTGTDSTDKLTKDTTPELTFTFSETIFGQDSDVVVVGPDSDPITPDSITGWASDTLVIVFSTPLVLDGEYTVTLNGTSTIEDEAGNPLNGGSDEVVNFTVDTIDPVVTVDTHLTSDSTPELTGTIDDPDASIDVTVDGNTYIADNNGDGTWTLANDTISTALADDTYDVAVVATDLAGNVGTDVTTDELTIDTIAPAVVSLSPPDDATDVAVGTNLVITFSEDIQKGTGNVVIKKSSDDTVVETIDVASVAVTVSGTQATIDASSDLAESTAYYVQIDGGAFEDLSGNDLAGISDKTTWNFTTAAAPAPVGDFCGANSDQPDGYVDYWDLLYFAQRWHSSPSDTNWDPRCDLDKEDNYVDYWDLLVFAQQWHKGVKPLVKGIDLWAAGHSYWDESGQKFIPGEQPSIIGETKVASWISGEQGPTWWTISPVNPTTGDVIYFSGPTGAYSNDCVAEGAAGGSPVITVDVLNHRIELWFQPPAPELSYQLWAPVCGIEGDFGPLEAGEWLFFGTDLFASFHIPFTIIVQPTLILSI